MSQPTEKCTHGPLFLCSLCYHDIPPSSTMSMETVELLVRETETAKGDKP